MQPLVLSGEDLEIEGVDDVARFGRSVVLDDEALSRAVSTHERVQEWGLSGVPIYGVNTGFGELIHLIVPARYRSDLQANLIRSHAAGGGPVFSEEVVRAVMLVRLNCLMKGHSGVGREVLERVVDMLRLGIHPVVPQQGSLGASGDLAPLSHVALGITGQGMGTSGGDPLPMADLFARHGLAPVELGYKEGLALINGTSAMTALSALNLVRTRRLLKLAVVGSAWIVQCLNASVRPFDERGHVLKNHPGAITVAAEMRKLLHGSGVTREHADIMAQITAASGSTEDVVDSSIYLQNAYSLRCMPQVLGPVLETVEFCVRTVTNEVNSCNDNPLIFDLPEESFHGANFHGQYVAMACDHLNVAIAEIGVLAERQLNRLVDPHLNGALPAFLAVGEAGLSCGFEGAQYLATSIASENLDLAAPASIKSLPSNGSNQDIVSMGLIAARRSTQLLGNVEQIVDLLIAACHQATLLIGADDFSGVRGLHSALADEAGLYEDDTPFFEHFAAVRRVLSTWDELPRLQLGAA